MSSRAKKLRNRLARQVIDGKVTVTEARARLGRQAGPVQKSARPGPVAPPTPGPPVPRYVGDEQYLQAAFRPIPWTSVTKTAAAGVRKTPIQDLATLKSMTPPAPVRRAHYWDGIDLGLLQQAREHSDPAVRENARAALAARIEKDVT
jgi:hypothetical protein